MIQKHEIYRGRKFHQVCRGARQVFLRDGYEGASVDDISRAAGVSKATLYSYFPHKRLMFEEVMRNEIAEAEKQIAIAPDNALPPSVGLPVVVETMARDAVSEIQTGLYRLGIAEARRFPKLARDYYDRILQKRSAILAAYLDHWVARGELDIADTRRAADQLWRMTGAALAERAVLLPQSTLKEASLREACAAALELFLRAYGASRAGDIPAAAQ